MATARTAPSNQYWSPAATPVDPDVPDEQFTWGKFHAEQLCSNIVYYVADGSSEQQWFQEACGAVIDKIADTTDTHHPMIGTLCHLPDGVEVRALTMAQLKLVPQPMYEALEPPLDDAAYRPDKYVQYMHESKPYVVSPLDGCHFEALIKQSMPFHTRFIVGDGTDDALDAVCITAKRIGNVPHIEVLFGEWDARQNRFEETAEDDRMRLKDLLLFDKLFKPSRVKATQKRLARAAQQLQEEEEDEGLVADFRSTCGEMVFKNHEGAICVRKEKRKKDEDGCKSYWSRLGNFEVLKLLRLTQDDTDERGPVQLLQCRRQIHDRNDRVLYLSTSDRPPTSDKTAWNAGTYVVEVPVQMASYQKKQEISLTFSKYCAKFTSNMSPDELMQLVSALPEPDIEMVIQYFGQQEKPDMWIFANCCLDDGVFRSHAALNVEMKQLFQKRKLKDLRESTGEHPTPIIGCPPHMAWHFSHQLQMHALPTIFKNNTMQAEVALAYAIATLKYRQHQEKMSVLHFPMCVNSGKPHDGKTLISTLCSALHGFYRRVAPRVSEASIASLGDMQKLHSNLLLFGDEFYKKDRGGQQAHNARAKCVGMVHSTYDGTVRTNLRTGLSKTMSPYMVATNEMPFTPAEDSAFYERIVFNLFNVTVVSKDKSEDLLKLHGEVTALMSTLLPHYIAIEFDPTHVSQMTDFLNYACGSSMSRVCNNWAIVAFYGILRRRIAFDLPSPFLEHCASACYAQYAMTEFRTGKHELDWFLAELRRLEQQSKVNKASEQCISWHNVRTNFNVEETVSPPGQAVSGRWLVFSQGAIDVVNREHGKHVTPEILMRAAEGKLITHPARFWDASRMWPLITLGTQSVLEEVSICDAYTRLESAAFWVDYRLYQDAGKKAEAQGPTRAHMDAFKTHDGMHLMEALDADCWSGYKQLQRHPLAKWIGLRQGDGVAVDEIGDKEEWLLLVDQGDFGRYYAYSNLVGLFFETDKWVPRLPTHAQWPDELLADPFMHYESHNNWAQRVLFAREWGLAFEKGFTAPPVQEEDPLTDDDEFEDFRHSPVDDSTEMEF